MAKSRAGETDKSKTKKNTSTKGKKIAKKKSAPRTTIVVNVKGGGAGGAKSKEKTAKPKGLWHNDKGNRSLGRAPAFGPGGPVAALVGGVTGPSNKRQNKGIGGLRLPPDNLTRNQAFVGRILAVREQSVQAAASAIAAAQAAVAPDRMTNIATGTSSGAGGPSFTFGHAAPGSERAASTPAPTNRAPNPGRRRTPAPARRAPVSDRGSTPVAGSGTLRRPFVSMNTPTSSAPLPMETETMIPINTSDHPNPRIEHGQVPSGTWMVERGPGMIVTIKRRKVTIGRSQTPSARRLNTEFDAAAAGPSSRPIQPALGLVPAPDGYVSDNVAAMKFPRTNQTPAPADRPRPASVSSAPRNRSRTLPAMGRISKFLNNAVKEARARKGQEVTPMSAMPSPRRLRSRMNDPANGATITTTAR